MWTIVFRFLKALYPYIKESLFGKQPLPEIIYKHRLTSFFFFAWLAFFAITGLFIDVTITLANEKDALRKELDQANMENNMLQQRLNDDVQDEKTITRLEREIERLDRENERYRRLLNGDEENTSTHN